MFHNNAVKLTGLYLLIIAGICVCFSVAVYQLSVQELDRGLRRPGVVLGAGPGGQVVTDEFREQLLQERESQYQVAKSRVASRLITVNALILVLGGLLSYYFARRTLQPIEAAHEALERFTADASHELRTPITAMRTENEVALLSTTISQAEVHDLLTSNIEELQKLTDLTNGLLRLARTESHEQLEVQTYNANQVIHEAISRIDSSAKNKQIKVTVHVPDEAKLRCDDTSFIEAMVIVLDNAVKYCKKRDEITVSLLQDKKSTHVRIADTGDGISKNQLPYIFDRFYRGDSSRSKNNQTGYGLGLAIAKNIMQLHAGDITADARKSKGAVFTLTLPN